MALFQPGQPKTGGRAKGVRNKLSHTFLNDLLDEWSAHGKEALRIARIEDPIRFTIMVAGLLPKELDITTSHIQEISDDDLVQYIEHVQRQIAGRIGSIENREAETVDGESSQLLPAIRQAT
jgi:hypothetical protein